MNPATIPKVRVSEVYASSQGEGPNVGKTTIFVRFGGCNLRCPGWPCDTQHAIDPQYRKDWMLHTVDELIIRIVKTADDTGAGIITLTGGEPFLQPKFALEYLVDSLRYDFQIECFSNGTLMYPEWAAEHISFIMDWKLPGSGEDPMDPNRLYNLRLLAGAIEGTKTYEAEGPAPNQSVKFVIKTHEDLAAAHALWWDKIYKAGLSSVEVFYGREWNSHLSDADLVKYVMDNQLPWRLNIQTHNYIWDPHERGR